MYPYFYPTTYDLTHLSKYFPPPVPYPAPNLIIICSSQHHQNHRVLCPPGNFLYPPQHLRPSHHLTPLPRSRSLLVYPPIPPCPHIPCDILQCCPGRYVWCLLEPTWHPPVPHPLITPLPCSDLKIGRSNTHWDTVPCLRPIYVATN